MEMDLELYHQAEQVQLVRTPLLQTTLQVQATLLAILNFIFQITRVTEGQGNTFT